MLILLSLIDRKHRRRRDALLMGLACAICMERLAALHAPAIDLATQSARSAWVHDGAPPAAAAGVGSHVAPNHARFMPQRTVDGPNAEQEAASIGWPAIGMSAEPVLDYPYASR